MQGQKGAINSLQESLAFEHGSTSSDSHVVEQQICWTNFGLNPRTDAHQETQNLTMWSVGESSSSSVPNPNYASSSSGPVEMEARQLAHKRKASDLSLDNSSSGTESSNIFQRPEGSNGIWQPASTNPTPTNTMPFDPLIPTLGSSNGGVSFGNRAIGNISRNVRMRVNDSLQQDQLPASNSNNNSNGNNYGLLNFSSQYPSLGLASSSSHAAQPVLRVPVSTRNLNVSSRSRSSSSRSNRPVASSVIGGSGDNNSRSTPTNISEHPLFVQPHRASLLYPSRRHMELLRRSLLSVDSGAANGDIGGQNSNLFSRIPPPVNASASSSQETGIPPVIALTGHHPHPHHHRARTSDRLLDGAFGFPYLSRTVPASSGRRGRLASEMRNVLDRMRRGEGLRFEDVMILDQSVFYGMADIHDRHRDMRLDIDNMSYEELLALEERIGNVNTGLTEENIYKHLKQKTYASVAGQPDAEPCCVCQEEYQNGDNVGVLECGHEFHTGCIKQWLLQKNSCPVCKAAASK